MHDRRLTGAMVARACGAQGAEVMSACLQANGDLRVANKERDEDEDEDETGAKG